MCKRHTAVAASAKLGPHQRIHRQNTAAQYSAEPQLKPRKKYAIWNKWTCFNCLLAQVYNTIITHKRWIYFYLEVLASSAQQSEDQCTC